MVNRQRMVYFYRVVPEDGSKPFAFSADRVLGVIQSLNREAGEAYLPTGFFDRLLGLVHGHDEPSPMLSLWTVDTVNAPNFERKGAIKTYDLLDDEGVADPSYAMFFEDQVMALLRPVYRSPGPTAVANYINHFTKANCAFDALISPDVLRQLQRPAEDVVFAKLRIKTPNLAAVAEVSPDVASALEAAVGPTKSTEVTVVWKATLKRDKARWWSSTRPVMQELVRSGAIENFETATVGMTGDHPVDLLKQQLTQSVAVDTLRGETGVTAEAAAAALLDAYRIKHDDIADALALG